MSFDSGVEYAFAGLIASLIIEWLLIIPDWGASDALMLFFAILINIILIASTFTDLGREKLPFILGYIFGSLIIIMVGL